VVRVDRTVRHPLYRKVVHRSQKFLVHDEQGCQKGDRVEIVESKPISRRKRWVIQSVLAHDRRIHEVVEEGAETESAAGSNAAAKAEGKADAGGGE
jgi:small subunit ribosomal protein S17